VRKLDAFRVAFDLAQPYAAAERLFDSLAILPRHLLEKAQDEGRLGGAWGLTTPASEIAGLGPFRLKSYVPGERIVLERNPYYWKVDSAGRPLPYLDELVFLLVPSDDAQVVRFKAGETDVISRLSAPNFDALSAEASGGRRLEDLGAGLDYTFLFFNLNDVDAAKLPAVARKQAWFKQTAFRQAVSAAVDRAGMVKLVYQGRATRSAAPRDSRQPAVGEHGPAPAATVARARRATCSAAPASSWRTAAARSIGRARDLHHRHQRRQRRPRPAGDDHPGRLARGRDPGPGGAAGEPRAARSRAQEPRLRRGGDVAGQRRRRSERGDERLGSPAVPPICGGSAPPRPSAPGRRRSTTSCSASS
jgi:hypothetical protein